jgi:very-short-patch-repair endonuclease
VAYEKMPVPPNIAAASMVDRCTVSELLTVVRALLPHSIQLFAGMSAPALRGLLEAAPEATEPKAARPVLFLGLPEAYRTDTIIAAAIDQLAGAAAGLWPLWFGGEDFSELNDSALSHQYLLTKLTTLRSRYPRLSTAWAEAAIRQILRCHNPRVLGAAAEMEWSQLCHAISPNGLIAATTVDQSFPQSAVAAVHALEWLAANGNVAIAVLCRELPSPDPPFDRLLYGARAVRPDDREIEPDNRQAIEVEASPATLLLPSVHGYPHPMSLIEQRLSKMIEADAELTSKFVFNARIEDVSLKSPKVDLLWVEGRLVIELDGAEHRAQRAYRDDRHRDYELLCAGYAVVRIPNEEIIEDFAKALEKIRSVVRLRRSPNGG